VRHHSVRTLVMQCQNAPGDVHPACLDVFKIFAQNVEICILALNNGTSDGWQLIAKNVGICFATSSRHSIITDLLLRKIRSSTDFWCRGH